MAKVKTYEEAVKGLATAKEAVSKGKEALEAFCKNNKIKKNSPAEDVKDKSTRIEYKRLLKELSEARVSRDEFAAASKELKPAKERDTKYKYPADCTTADQKKKFRASERARIKREEKAKNNPKKEAAEKTSKKSDKTEKEAPAKKAIKKSARSED